MKTIEDKLVRKVKKVEAINVIKETNTIFKELQELINIGRSDLASETLDYLIAGTNKTIERVDKHDK